MQPGLAVELLQSLAGTIRLLSAQVDAMAFLRADERIARLLTRLADETAPCTPRRRSWPTSPALSRVTVSRALARMEREGACETGLRLARAAQAAAQSRAVTPERRHSACGAAPESATDSFP